MWLTQLKPRDFSSAVLLRVCILALASWTCERPKGFKSRVYIKDHSAGGIVDTRDAAALAFYKKYGFLELPRIE